MQPTQSMIWDGQGPVMIGRYDPINGRPDTGYLVDLYRIGCGTSSLTTSLSVERASIKESCSGQRLALKNYITGKTLEVGLNMVQFSGRTLAGAFFGDAALSAAGTVTDEVLPQLAVGDYFTVRHPGATSLVRFARQQWRAWIETLSASAASRVAWIRPSAMAGVD